MQETKLVTYILKCSAQNDDLSSKELRKLAFQYANQLNLEYPENWNEDKMAGKKWYYKFMKRHPNLPLRASKPTSSNRVETFCIKNDQTIFQNFEDDLRNQDFDGTNIYNMNEFEFSTVVSDKNEMVFCYIWLLFFHHFSIPLFFYSNNN